MTYTVLRHEEQGWSYARCEASGNEGFIPTTYVTPVPSYPVIAAPAPPPPPPAVTAEPEPVVSSEAEEKAEISEEETTAEDLMARRTEDSRANAEVPKSTKLVVQGRVFKEAEADSKRLVRPVRPQRR